MTERAALPVEELLNEWERLSTQERDEAFANMPRDQADDLLLDLSFRDQLDLIHSLPPGERRIWLRLLPPDDAADGLMSPRFCASPAGYDRR